MNARVFRGSLYLVGVLFVATALLAETAQAAPEGPPPSQQVLDLLGEGRLMDATALYELSALREAWGPSRRRACRALAGAWYSEAYRRQIRVVRAAHRLRRRRTVLEQGLQLRGGVCRDRRALRERLEERIQHLRRRFLLVPGSDSERELLEELREATEGIERTEARLAHLRASRDRLRALHRRMITLRRRADESTVDKLARAIRYQDQIVVKRLLRPKDATPEEVLLAAELHYRAAKLQLRSAGD